MNAPSRCLVLVLALVLGATAVCADVVESMAVVLDASAAHNRYAPVGITGNVVRWSHALLDELAAGADPLPCVVKHKDTPLGAKLLGALDSPQLVQSVMDLYAAVFCRDYCRVVANLGTATRGDVAPALIGSGELGAALDDVYAAQSKDATLAQFLGGMRTSLASIRTGQAGMPFPWDAITGPSFAFNPSSSRLITAVFSKGTNIYLFQGTCAVTRHGNRNTGDLASVVSYSVLGVWDGRLAFEFIRLSTPEPAKWLPGATELHIVGRCARDPWLHDDAGWVAVNEDPGSLHQQIFGAVGFPRSRVMLKAAHKPGLIAQAGTRDWSLLAPNIYSPGEGAVIDGTKHMPEVFARVKIPAIVDNDIQTQLFDAAEGQIGLYPVDPTGKLDAFPADGRHSVTASHLKLVGQGLFKHVFDKLPAGPWAAKAWLKGPGGHVPSNERRFVVEGTGAQVKTPAAPVFEQPAQGATCALLAPIAIEVEHQVAYPLEFQIAHSRLVTKPARGPDIMSVHAFVPAGGKDVAGRYTGTFVPKESGRWKFRARCVFPYGEAPWSDWRSVVVPAKGSAAPPPGPPQAPRRPRRGLSLKLQGLSLFHPLSRAAEGASRSIASGVAQRPPAASSRNGIPSSMPGTCIR